MTATWAVLVAAAAFAGALWSGSVPLVPAVAVAVLAVILRWPLVLTVAALLLASSLGARAWAGVAPVERDRVEGEMTLASDPVETDGGIRVLVSHEGDRLEAHASGKAAESFREALAGERLEVAGLVAPRPDDQPWLAHRHVVGLLDVTTAGAPSRGTWPSTAANALRRTLSAGTDSLTPDQRSLFLGLVLGDDREQRDEVAEDFRAAGLTHLLAVSGQNVAFVLALAAPLTRRMRLGGRWAVIVALLGGFCLLTRFEPSIIRAAGMAGVAASSAALGRSTTGVRNLAIAVTVLVLVDPLLVHRLGFRLSIAASAGILALSPLIAGSLPGPVSLRQAAAVTLGAQVGVAPLIIPAFGGMPVAAIPANLLAVPAAGPVMMWGLTGGLLAGVVGHQVAWLLHLPTGLLLDWLLGVAHTAAGWQFGQLAVKTGVLVFAAGGVLIAAKRAGRRAAVLLAAAALGVALCVTAVTTVDDGPDGVGWGGTTGVRSARASPARPAPIRHHQSGTRHGHSQPHPRQLP